MNNPLKHPVAASLGLFFARAPLGAYFAIAGYNKIAGKGSVTAFVHSASGMIPPFLPAPIGAAYLYLLPFFEIGVGALLVAGLFTRVAGLLAACMLTSFMIAVTGISDPHLPFQPNLVFLGPALLALLAGGGDISLDRAALGRAEGRIR